MTGPQSDEEALDRVTLEVIQNALDSLADEMALTLMRSSYSGIVRDGLDYSAGLCDNTGCLLAQGATIPLHLGSFPDVMASLLARFGKRIDPGDIFILNDPYGSGGIHLPDIFIIQPIFAGGQLLAFACTIAHHTDIGGIVPGSNSIHSTEIYQEGLRIPALKLYERGQPNEAIFEILAKNVRVPALVLGDLRAQLAACSAGERAYLDLVARYGAATLRAYQDRLMDDTERNVRSQIEAIPDGTYVFTDYIDGLGEDPQPIRFQVKVTVHGSQLTVDFEGTSGQVKAGLNSPLPFSKSAVYLAVRSVMTSEVPNNAGYFRPIKIIAPLGTIVNPRDLAPCAVRGITGFRIVDAIFGALAQAIPDRVPADGEGGSSLVSIGGYYKEEPFIYVESMMGTWGARPNGDGTDGAPHPAANQTNQPIEIIEATLPLMVETYCFVPDSGGVGQYRGGLALMRSWRVLAAEALLTMRSDKRRFPPYGLAGGGPGLPSANTINPGQPDERALPVLPMEAVPLRRGDLFVHRMPAGGGWGDAMKRDPSAVLEDVLDDKMTLHAAYAAYGVVIDLANCKVDFEATRQLRASRQAGI